MPRGVSGTVTVVDGFPMHFKKKIKDATESLYHCVHRNRKIGCTASFAVHDNGTIRKIRSHFGHEKNSIETRAETARVSLKDKAASTTATARSIIKDLRSQNDAEVTIQLGDYHSLRRIINSVRNRTNSDKKLVDSTLQLHGCYKETNNSERFVLCEKRINSKPFLIMASDECLSILSSSTVLFADGTFDVVPEGFAQLFTLHAYVSQSVIRPLVYCLLPSKEQVVYLEVFQELKKVPYLLNWNPSLIICDFELGLRNAFTQSFPAAQLHGCYFHAIKSWRSKMTALGIYEDTFEGQPLHEFWILLKALPFISANEIPNYFDILEDTLPVNTQASEFLTYFKKYYVYGNVNQSPRFPPSMWTCGTVTLSGVHWTTNSIEVWHRLLRPVVNETNGLRKISLSRLIEKIKEEEEIAVQDYNTLLINPVYQCTKARKTSNVLKDQRLQKVLRNQPIPPNKALSGLDFLRAISFALKP